jgi:hypothetical protein
LLQAGYGFMRDRLVTVAFIDSIRQNMIAEPTFTRGQIERHMTGTSEHFIVNIDKLYRECQQRGIVFVALKQQTKSHMVKKEDMKSVTYAQEVQMIKDKLEKEGALRPENSTFLHIAFSRPISIIGRLPTVCRS